MTCNKKTVLHILGRVDSGGIGRWIVDLCNHRVGEYKYKILCISGDAGRWRAKLPADVEVYTSPNLTGGIAAFMLGFWRFLRNQDIDIVHAHTYRFSILPLIIASVVGKKTIAHSHTDRRATSSGFDILVRRALHWCFRWFVDLRIGVSVPAGLDLFGESQNFIVIHCGIHVPFLESSLRREDTALISGNSRVRLTCVGSLNRTKNHEFILGVVKKLKNSSGYDYQLTIVGDGPLREYLNQKVEILGLRETVKFLGMREDVFDILQYETDIFLFPSLYEGLGLALVEAQAAGVKCIVSPAIPREAEICADLITRVELHEDAWCHAIMSNGARCARMIDRISANERIRMSSFNIDNAFEKLSVVYDRLLAGA